MIWSDAYVAASVGLVAPGLLGVIAGWWMPRGPLTSREALLSMLVCLGVGGVAGLVMRSRWATLAAPAAFAVVFELVRHTTEGPTVDGLHLSRYGIIAFLTGRGFLAVTLLLPMALGAALGAGAARRIAATFPHAPAPDPGSRAGRVVAGVTALGLVALAAGLARPASTDALVDAAGVPVPGSVAELTEVDVNGRKLALMIRGQSLDNPVLLFLAGGPGATELGAMRRHLPGLEEHFTVVTWDQRGAGKSYPALDPTDTVTLDGYVDDTIAVTDHLRDIFGQDRIYLLGQSWGSTLGVLAVQRHPELYRAYVGTGQLVSQLETDRILYRDTVAWAQATGDDGLVEELTTIGPPPYEDVYDYETVLGKEPDVYPYDHSPNAEGPGQMSENLFVEEYSLIDQVHALAAFLDTFAALYPQLQGIDLRDTATQFEVPVFFVQGAHEADARAALFDEWYAVIEAPDKERTVLDTSGHRPLFEQPDRFVDYLVDTVLPATQES